MTSKSEWPDDLLSPEVFLANPGEPWFDRREKRTRGILVGALDALTGNVTLERWEAFGSLLSDAVLVLRLGNQDSRAVMREFLPRWEALYPLIDYRKVAGLPDPEVVLADPANVNLGDVERTFALVRAVFAALDAEVTAERWVAFGDLLVSAFCAGLRHLAFTYGVLWTSLRPERVMPSRPFVEAFAPYLASRGLL